jgi:predicted GIY-YIG superfamily endonuclease
MGFLMKQTMYYFYVYILQCCDGSYYVGMTDDLERRIAEHNNGAFVGYTSMRLPVALVWVDFFGTRDEAFSVERQIKSWSRGKKQALVRGEWKDLRVKSKKVLIKA